MSSKQSLAELAHPEYWNTRYEKTSAEGKKENDVAQNAYDWLRDFSSIKPFLLKHLPQPTNGERGGPRILHLGCGNSALTAQLSHLRYSNQISVDFSPVVIVQQRAAYPELEWAVADVRDLSLLLGDASVDVAVDKATLDAMLYGSLWDPEEEVVRNVGAYVDEVVRVLRPGGLWLYITWRQPHFIKPLLKREGIWTVESEVLEDASGGGGGMFEYYGYVMRKNTNA